MTAAEPTRYDIVAYPATLFPATHPDHLAVVARLHGLAATAVETARVLEIAGGDGVNLIAMAAAYPRARFVSFDLSAAAVARGRSLAAAAGLTNIRIETGDVIEAAASMPGEFDYIIVHGLYAWVPEPVRTAALALIGRVLAPDGAAFVSYNALPGGHMRRIVRDLLLHHVGGIADPAAKARRAREVLADFAVPRATDRPVMTGVRDVARPMLKQSLETLYHDELSDVYAPQALADVVAAAAHGLAFLNDASPSMMSDGFPGADVAEADVVAHAQAGDFAAMVFFHQTLLVRAGRQPARAVAQAALPDLYVAARAERTGAETFRLDDSEFGVGDAMLADALEDLAKIWPQRVKLAALVDGADRWHAVYRLFCAEVLTLHASPLPGVVEPGEQPRANPVARAQIAAGQPHLFTLDHHVITMDAAGPRAFLMLLDGSRNRERLGADWAASGHGHEVDVATALAQVARIPMLIG